MTWLIILWLAVALVLTILSADIDGYSILFSLLWFIALPVGLTVIAYDKWQKRRQRNERWYV